MYYKILNFFFLERHFSAKLLFIFKDINLKFLIKNEEILTITSQSSRYRPLGLFLLLE